jgi:GTP cyclohydrolase III
MKSLKVKDLKHFLNDVDDNTLICVAEYIGGDTIINPIKEVQLFQAESRIKGLDGVGPKWPFIFLRTR